MNAGTAVVFALQGLWYLAPAFILRINTREVLQVFPTSAGKEGFLRFAAVCPFPHRLRRSDLNLPLLLICLACDIVSLSLLDLCRIKLIDGVDDELNVAEEMVDSDARLSDGDGPEGTVQRRKCQDSYRLRAVSFGTHACKTAPSTVS